MIRAPHAPCPHAAAKAVLPDLEPREEIPPAFAATARFPVQVGRSDPTPANDHTSLPPPSPYKPPAAAGGIRLAPASTARDRNCIAVANGCYTTMA
jgi:hypothetical protein